MHPCSCLSCVVMLVCILRAESVVWCRVDRVTFGDVRLAAPGRACSRDSGECIKYDFVLSFTNLTIELENGEKTRAREPRSRRSARTIHWIQRNIKPYGYADSMHSTTGTPFVLFCVCSSLKVQPARNPPRVEPRAASATSPLSSRWFPLVGLTMVVRR